MGNCKTKEILKDLKEAKDKLKEVEMNYLKKADVDNLKQDLKHIVQTGLEFSIPILEAALLDKGAHLQKKQVSELTKSFVTSTFKNVNEKMDMLNKKIEIVDNSKVSKVCLNPSSRMTDDTVNFG